ncbi:MAG TPA: DUF2249 domain-containing protein [Gammaproteobacteria bacterium]|nr:DUF2249 domain-containing protein [Gammaproteobacteria bacterium]
MTDEILLDMRNREPPEPLFATLDAVEELQPGQLIRLLIHREPLMLYPQLQQLGVPWKVESWGAPDWVIIIGPRPDGSG